MRNIRLTASTFALLLLLTCLIQPLCSCKEQPRPSKYANLKEALQIKEADLTEMEADLSKMNKEKDSLWRWLTKSLNYNLNLKKNIEKKEAEIKETQKEVEELRKKIETARANQKVYLTQIDIEGLPNHNIGRPVNLEIYYKAKDFDKKNNGELLYQQKGCPAKTSCKIGNEKLVQKGAVLAFLDTTGFNEHLANISLDKFHEHAIDTEGATGKYTEIIETTHRGPDTLYKDKIETTIYTLHYRKENQPQ